jgi:hypothetical protein
MLSNRFCVRVALERPALAIAWQVATLLLAFGVAEVAWAEEGLDGDVPDDLDEVSLQLDNPLTSLWSLTFENKTFIQEGNATKDREL